MISQRFVFLSAIIFIISLACPSLRVHARATNQSPLISITLKETSVGDALNRLSTIAGYDIKVSHDWASKVIGLVLNDCSLEDSLAKILAAAGNPSYLVITDKDRKTIEIFIVGPARDGTHGGERERVSAQIRTAETEVQESEPNSSPNKNRISHNALRRMRQENHSTPADSELDRR
jgi:hypothetical protein